MLGFGSRFFFTPFNRGLLAKEVIIEVLFVRVELKLTRKFNREGFMEVCYEEKMFMDCLGILSAKQAIQI